MQFPESPVPVPESYREQAKAVLDALFLPFLTHPQIPAEPWLDFAGDEFGWTLPPVSEWKRGKSGNPLKPKAEFYSTPQRLVPGFDAVLDAIDAADRKVSVERAADVARAAALGEEPGLTRAANGWSGTAIARTRSNDQNLWMGLGLVT